MSRFIPRSPLQSRATILLNRAAVSSWLQRATAIQDFLAAMRTLVERIGLPLFHVRPLEMHALPYRDDFTAMVDDARHDTATLHGTLPLLAQQGVELYNYTISEHTALTEQLDALDHTLGQLDAQQRRLTPGHFVGVGVLAEEARRQGERIIETLDTDATIDYSACSGVSYIPRSQWVTLKEAASINHSQQARLSVQYVDEQGRLIGLPGTTTEVVGTTPSATTAASTVAFVGELGRHDEPKAVLDDDPLTWFEFERCALLAPAQSVVQTGSAWNYSGTGAEKDIAELIAPDTWSVSLQHGDEPQTFSKLGEPIDGVLHLTMALTLPEPRLITHIDIDPFLPAAASHIPASIESVTALTSSGDALQIPITGRTLNRTVRIPVQTAERIAKIECRLSQPSGYTTLLGHQFYLVTVQHTLVDSGFIGFGAAADSNTTTHRIEHPDDASDYQRQWTSHHGFLDTHTSVHTDTPLGVESGIDTFMGKRWQIGLRTVALIQARYESQGTFVSRAHTFSKPVRNIKVLPNAQVPHGTSLQWSVSGDDGSTWVIADTSGACMLAKASSTVRVRAILLRTDARDEAQQLTPIIHGYELQGTFA